MELNLLKKIEFLVIKKQWSLLYAFFEFLELEFLELIKFLFVKKMLKKKLPSDEITEIAQ